MERTPRQVKNKTAAPIQITAEQILREANETKDIPLVIPKQKITDKEELLEYQLGKRKQFEDIIRRNRTNPTNWMKYAAWEESQFELER